MNRWPRLMLLATCFLSSVSIHCTRTPPPRTFPPQGKFLVLKKVFSRLPPVSQTDESPAAERWYKCYRTWELIVTVERGADVVKVSDDSPDVEVNDCVKWVVQPVNGDPNPPTIALIDFIETQGDSDEHGKPVNSKFVGDKCRNAGSSCSELIDFPAMPDGSKRKYKYVVRVNHEGRGKKSDPELEVSCSGCGEF